MSMSYQGGFALAEVVSRKRSPTRRQVCITQSCPCHTLKPILTKWWDEFDSKIHLSRLILSKIEILPKLLVERLRFNLLKQGNVN